MLIFSIIIYTLFGGMCIWFVISGVQKMKQIKAEQAAQAESRTKEEDLSQTAESQTSDKSSSEQV